MERSVTVVFAEFGFAKVPVPFSTDHVPVEFSSGSAASRVVVKTNVSSWSTPAFAVGCRYAVTVTGLTAEQPPGIVPLM